jgi:predicted nucleic acid-binding protein
MTARFADTYSWIALTNLNDSAHERALFLASDGTNSLLVTTDEVLVEFLTFFGTAPEPMCSKAFSNTQGILTNPGVRVIPQSRSSLLSGTALYGARPDKGYSLTDCIAMQAISREGLIEAIPTTAISSRRVSGRSALSELVNKPYNG